MDTIRFAASFREAVGIMENHREVMAAAVPLEMTPELKALEAHIIDRQVACSFEHYPSMTETRELDAQMGRLAAALPVTFEQEEISSYARMLSQPGLSLRSRAGQVFDHARPDLPENYYVSHLIVQGTDQQFVPTAGFHRDSCALTINTYLSGRGVQYKVIQNGQPVLFSARSPVLTIHRGVSHKFGYDGAVDHRPQDNRGVRRANIVYAYT